MSLKHSVVEYIDLALNPRLRLWLPSLIIKSKYQTKKLIDVIDSIETGNRPKGGITNIEEGAISLGGEQINVNGYVDLTNTPYVPIEFYKKTTKGHVNQSDILLCKDGALTGKTCFVDINFPVDKVMVNEHVFIFKANPEYFIQKFLFYIMYNNIIQYQIRDLAYRKKGQPGLNLEHIRQIKIPYIPKPIQKNILQKIGIIEHRISKLRQQIKQHDEIINKVFQREFKFDFDTFTELKKEKMYNLNLSDFGNNKDVRQSVKFHRNAGKFVWQELRKVTSKKIKNFLAEPIVLGSGISPNNFSNKGVFCYISMADIKNWEFDQKTSKLVSINYSDSNQNKIVTKDDIILARSGEGTIGKVALIEKENIKGIFADFTMRIRLSNYNCLFAFYYFRSNYFQYLIEINKKGLGNNTNIFPSQIKEFPMFDIPLSKQNRIVEEIKEEIDNQELINKNIKKERDKIEKIIDEAISKS